MSNNAYWDKWYQENKLKKKLYDKEYNKENRARRTAYNKLWRAKNRDLVQFYARNNALKKLYGITYEKKLEMRESQNHKCAICLTDFDSEWDCKVDHDHKTGVLRGLLCNNCNTLLGRAKDDIRVLSNAIAYLKKSVG